MENHKEKQELLRVNVVKSILAVMNQHKTTKSVRANSIINKLQVIETNPEIATTITQIGIVAAIKKGVFDSPSSSAKRSKDYDYFTMSVGHRLFSWDHPLHEIIDNRGFVSRILELGKTMRKSNGLTDQDLYEEINGTVFDAMGRIVRLDSWVMFSHNVKQKRSLIPSFKKWDDKNIFIKDAAVAGDHAIDSMLTYAAETDRRMNAKLKTVFKSSREISKYLCSAIKGNEQKMEEMHPELLRDIRGLTPKFKGIGALIRKLAMGNRCERVYESRILVDVVAMLKSYSGANKNHPEASIKALESLSLVIEGQSKVTTLTEEESSRIKDLANSIKEVSEGIRQKQRDALT